MELDSAKNAALVQRRGPAPTRTKNLHPHLDIDRCFTDTFQIWTKHFFVLTVASAIAVILGAFTGTLLLGSLYAGLLTMILRAMRGEKTLVGDVFIQVRRFVRFFAITWFVIMLTFVGLAFLIVPGVLFGTWCFYMFLLAADRNATVDESFVMSRRAVARYGFWRHFFLIIFALGIPAVAAVILRRVGVGTSPPLTFLVLVLLQPFSLGLLVSAYRQTLEVEAEQTRQRNQQFAYMRDELQTAHDMQMDLLPREGPEVEGYTLFGICDPANTVGGDYFAYRWLDEAKTRLAIVIADVSGKAMGAAITALRFNEMLRYECRGRTAPADILEGLNCSLEGQIDVETFITCSIVVLDTVQNTLELSNAGHCYPYHYKSKNKLVGPVQVPGFPLGIPPLIRPDEPYASVCVTLERGDALVLYSDGIPDAQSPDGELYDPPRFEALLNAAAEADAVGIVKAAVDDVQRFIDDAPRTDDLTIVVLKRQ